VAINITLFEKTERIGGRSLTVDAYDDPLQPVELGASIFVNVNHILWNASHEFNLPLIDPGPDEDTLLGVWNGDEFVFEQDSTTSWWWDVAKLVWKYGTAPYYTRNLVKETVATFLKLYEEPHFPYRSLTTRVYELGLHKITGLTGQQFLEEKGLYGLFARHLVQTATRVNYASNLAYIHGLGAMVCTPAEAKQQMKKERKKGHERTRTLTVTTAGIPSSRRRQGCRGGKLANLCAHGWLRASIHQSKHYGRVH
jgi:prenylcysteine oxidase / farnesylcysteine lyase